MYNKIMDYVYGVINGYDLGAVYVTYRFWAHRTMS